MENLAREFDLPTTSREHANLAETAWMAGCLVTVRFYLGRLLARNLFRETDAEVEERLVEFISRSTSPAGGNLVRGMSGWDIAGELLRHRFETQTKGASCFKDLYITVIERFLCNPSLTLAELAKEVGTTEKQLRRNSTLTAVRKLRAKPK